MCLQIGPRGVFMIALSIIMAFFISAHADPDVRGDEDLGRNALMPPVGSIFASDEVDIRLISSPPMSESKSPSKEEYVKFGRAVRAFRPSSSRRFLESEGFTYRAGSTPPSCDGKCQGCTPCDLQPIVIPHMVGVSSVEYKYEHWACVCKKMMYMTKKRT